MPDDKARQAMFDWLAQTHSFDWGDLQNMFKGSLSDQQFGLLFHEVRERLRVELHVEFITHSFSSPGTYFRANDEQKMRRSQNFVRTAFRKQMRAGRVLDAVNEDNLPDERRSVLQRMRDNLSHLLMRGRHAQRASEPMPTAPARPDIPRRRGQ